MIDYILMSDIRTKILLGTTISAVSLMLVMAVSMGAVQNNVPVSTTLGLVGHFEIFVDNPDGSAYYAQTDNTVTKAGKEKGGDDLFTVNARTGPFLCTQLGTGANNVASASITTPLTDTDEVCDAGPTSANAAANGAAGAAQVNTITTIATIDGIGGVDGNDQCLTTCNLTEVVLHAGPAQNTGAIFAHAALSDAVVANTQASVTVVYKVATGGTIP